MNFCSYPTMISFTPSPLNADIWVPPYTYLASLKLCTLVWSSYMHSDPSYQSSLKAKSLLPIRTIEMLHKTNSKCFLFHSMICAYFTNLLFTEESKKTGGRGKKCRLVCFSLSFYIINFNISWLMKESNMRQCLIFFTFSYCSLVFQGKNTEVVCHSLLQWTTFCQNSPPWPIHLGWSYMAWLIVSLSLPSFGPCDQFD